MPTNKTVKIWSWGKAASIQITVDDSGFGVIDGSARKAFTCGQCHALAYALNKLAGWPIKGLGSYWENDPKSPIHCVVWSPSLKAYVDINGTHRKPPDRRIVVNRNIRRGSKLKYYHKPNVKAAIPFAKTILRDLNVPFN